MSKKINTAILISGRGSNMEALIKACDQSNFPAKISLVIANKNQAQGLIFAKNHGIKTNIIEHQNFLDREQFEKKINQILLENNIELICLAGFMRILSPFLVKQWKDRIINIHPSLLPDFKGANAVKDAIEAKVKISGCTTHFVSEKVDDGKIIMQAQVEVSPDDDQFSLAKKILSIEHQIYPATLKKVCETLLKNVN
jgi:phosphoribosylglycinamide formyltransferase-1